MNEQQAQRTLVYYGAQYVTSKGGVQWYRLPDGSWVAKRLVGGLVDLKKLPANACGCG